VLGGLAVSPEDVWRPCGAAGDAAGQAPPVGLVVQLGQMSHAQRDT
jgi:hypothetical protein